MRDTYLDQIRSTPDMKEMSVSTTVHPVEHQLEGSGFLKRERNMMDVLAGHKNPFHGSGMDLDKDPLRGGNVFSDIVKAVSFLPIPFISDIARTATLTGLVK